MTEKHFILATAGHVDHGKSALVKALTGTDPDRLPEEKARKITIELGFAELTLDPPNEQRVHVGIIDVPGHEDFVRNMIAGVGSIDLALLVVAADDGWMPQSEEHLQILSYLGVERAVVALTKSDIVDPTKTEAEVREKLRGTAFANAPIVRTAFDAANLTGLTGQVPGMVIAELKEKLVAELSELEPPRDIGRPRLFVDRAFTLRGIGTVVTGTLTGGTFSRGQTLIVQPQNLPTRIRSIQSHGRDIGSAQPGTRTALNLADVDIGTGQRAVRRGDVISNADLGSPNDILEVLIERSPRIKRDAPAAKPIKNRSSLYLHHGTRRVAAKVILLENEVLSCGDGALAELRLESPIFAFLGDRFVLRDPSERFTIGGGIVLALSNDEGKSSRTPERLALLSAQAGGPHDIDLYLKSEVLRRGFSNRKRLLRQSNFSGETIAASIEQLKDRGEIVVAGEIVADANDWRVLLQRATAFVNTFHQQHPDHRGPELSDLRGALGEQPAEVFEAIVSELCRNGFVREKSTIARQSHRASLPVEINPVAEKIRAMLAAKLFDPPARREIAQDRNHEQALRFLIEQGEVVDVSPDVVLLKNASHQMRRTIVEFISKNGPATASALRQHLGSSRRVMIPFLENLDRTGVTQRIGDSRQLRKPKSAAAARP